MSLQSVRQIALGGRGDVGGFDSDKARPRVSPIRAWVTLTAGFPPSVMIYGRFFPCEPDHGFTPM